jgi:hypothetical protein
MAAEMATPALDALDHLLEMRSLFTVFIYNRSVTPGRHQTGDGPVADALE